MGAPVHPSPFKVDAATLISGKAEHLFSAIAMPLNASEFELDVTSVSVAFDESWAPHIQARLTCALPDTDKLALLDARLGCRVQIVTGYRYGKDDEETALLADLHLRSRTIRHSTGEVTLELESDEALLQDYITYGSESLSRADLNSFVVDVLSLTYLGFPYQLRSAFSQGKFAAEMKGDPATVSSNGTELTPVLGKTAWTLLDEAQRRTGTWIYSPFGRDWRITERAEITSAPVMTLTIGENGTILDGESTLSRNGFYNEVLLRYEWTDDNLIPADRHQIGQARITGGPFSIDLIGRNTYVETIDRRANKDEADRAAVDKLSRLLTRGHEYTVRAVAAYWLMCGDTIALNIDGKTEKLLVKSVNFDPSEGTMALVLRKPEIATISNEF
ncbi:hypothetical protein [Arthrobacter oryzae]|uniref:Uncharacterized protein n=1 Tax=Arthrobacter oryzae TaxID=409290 RepID=A0A3N0C777_9MICC|nr:hypothetical protein [Arthrobacter oryzae]RNL58970.1 hypothetical protein D7003_03015 [Arthrobacter oryzae]